MELRWPRFQLTPGLFGRFGIPHPAQRVEQAVHVRIHANAGLLIPTNVVQDVRHFRADSGQFHHLVRGGWYVTVVILDQKVHSLLDVLGFVVVKPDPANVSIQCFG